MFKSTKYAAIYQEITASTVDQNCAICKSLNDDYSITLDCQHRYHVDCLKKCCSMTNIRCPYCNAQHHAEKHTCKEDGCETASYYEKGLCYKHLRKHLKSQKKVLLDGLRCQANYKSGKRKGQRCANRKAGEQYCRVHQPKSEV